MIFTLALGLYFFFPNSGSGFRFGAAGGGNAPSRRNRAASAIAASAAFAAASARSLSRLFWWDVKLAFWAIHVSEHFLYFCVLDNYTALTTNELEQIFSELYI
jgi:hypothetical protein